MITSMTGFARREANGPFGQLACELRSVNHRYLEAGFRLPEELRALETELRQALARELRRGKVDCSIHLRAAANGAAELLIDDRALANLLDVRYRFRDDGSINHTSALVLLDANGQILARSEVSSAIPDPVFIDSVRKALASN